MFTGSAIHLCINGHRQKVMDEEAHLIDNPIKLTNISTTATHFVLMS